MSLLKLFVAGLIVVCISVLGSLVILAIFGPLAVSFVEWFEEYPLWRGVLALVGLVLIVVFSRWLLRKVV